MSKTNPIEKLWLEFKKECITAPPEVDSSPARKVFMAGVIAMHGEIWRAIGATKEDVDTKRLNELNAGLLEVTEGLMREADAKRK